MKFDEKSRVLLIVLISSFIPPFMSSSVNVALPAISACFELDAISLNWVAASYILSTAIFLLPSGRFADVYGRLGIFTAGMAIAALSSLSAGLAQSFFCLIAARIAQGIGSAFIFSTGVAMLSEAYKPEVRGKMLGITVATVYIGLTAGPFLGGFLTQTLGWRSIFISTVPLSIIGFAPALAMLKKNSHTKPTGSMDIAGAIIYACALFMFIYGFSLLPGKGYLLILLGIMAFAGFIFRENSQKSPLVDLKLFTKNRVFAFSNLAALINYSATFSSAFLISLYLQYIKGMSPEDAGMMLVASPVVMAIIAPFSGRLSDKINARILASAGMAILALGLMMLVFLSADTHPYYVVFSLVIMGTGFGIFSSPNTNAIMGSVDKKDYGVASGMLATMRMTGQALSMAVVMVVFSVVIGRVEIAPENYAHFIKSIHFCFMLNTILCILGVFASLARNKNLSLP